eukprot:scaffold4587_cov182-Amphora_coffeaeformis.AAC.19
MRSERLGCLAFLVRPETGIKLVTSEGFSTMNALVLDVRALGLSSFILAAVVSRIKAKYSFSQNDATVNHEDSSPHQQTNHVTFLEQTRWHTSRIFYW